MTEVIIYRINTKGDQPDLSPHNLKVFINGKEVTQIEDIDIQFNARRLGIMTLTLMPSKLTIRDMPLEEWEALPSEQ